MKPSKVDIQIMEILNYNRNSPELFNLKRLAKLLGKAPSQISRNLKKLESHDLITRTGKNPVYFEFKSPKCSAYIIIPTKCRKCGFVESIMLGQTTKTCSNCKKRYYLSKKRIQEGLFSVTYKQLPMKATA